MGELMSVYSITSFRGEYSFLSNFYREPDNTCVEVEFQMAKCLVPDDRSRFTNLTAGEAKRLGRKIPLRADWEKVKVKVMHELVLRKFQDHSSLYRKLMGTKGLLLVEGNNWGDTFWGKADVGGRLYGENWLGTILMDVRDFCL